VVAPEEITRHHDWADRKNGDIWVGGRADPEPIVIVDWDPTWPDRYDAVAARIRATPRVQPARVLARLPRDDQAPDVP